MQQIKVVTDDKNIAGALEFIFQNAWGNPLYFDSAPTLAQMKPNTWGKYSTRLYVKFGNNTGLYFTGTAFT